MENKEDKETAKRTRRKLFFTDLLAIIIILNSIAWVWCSYLLAFIRRVDTVSTVSGYVVMDVIVIFATIAAKAFGENLSKNNEWPDKPHQVVVNTNPVDSGTTTVITEGKEQGPESV